MILLKVVEKIFHSIDYRCVYDIKITNFTNTEKVILTISIGYMEFKSRFYGSSNLIKNARIDGFMFNMIVKLAKILDSSLSNIYTCYYLKFLIPIRHRQFFKIISQNPEYVKTHCNDLFNPFHFACRKWYLDNQSL